MNCTECRYCYMQDYGYSNYTIEGTEFVCLKRLHPDGDFDRFYGENQKLKHAEKCESFEVGGGLHIDCDRENGGVENYTNDPEVIKLYEAL